MNTTSLSNMPICVHMWWGLDDEIFKHWFRMNTINLSNMPSYVPM